MKERLSIIFDPSLTFASGQAFRWRPIDNAHADWVGIISDSVVKVSGNSATMVGTNQKNLDFQRLIESYFSFEDDLSHIFSTFPQDEVLTPLLKEFEGLRLLTQDPWECLISFVCSINCNIPSIKLKIENLSRRYGNRIENSIGEDLFSFPTPEALAKAEKKDLLQCRVGFRWRYIKHIAQKVSSGQLDLEKIRGLQYSEATKHLISEETNNTLGVGPKVADCALLYSLHKTEAFPIDVWILRCMKQYYAETIGLTKFNLTPKTYNTISESMRKRFGKYAGYAQLYLYSKMRNSSVIQDRLQA